MLVLLVVGAGGEEGDEEAAGGSMLYIACLTVAIETTSAIQVKGDPGRGRHRRPRPKASDVRYDDQAYLQCLFLAELRRDHEQLKSWLR